MADSTHIQVFDSQGEPYQHAFRVFLDHTDQKATARAFLDGLVDQLPARRVFIDAGAGNGKVTAWFVDRFDRSIAIEPNPFLRDELKKLCPGAEVLADGILGAKPQAVGDLILCSHVFYYLDAAEWLPTLERLASWLSPTGVLAVVLQNHETDCMKMLDHFCGRRFNLAELARAFEAAHGREYTTRLDTVPAYITTPDFASAYTVAEFMLNLVPLTPPPLRREVEEYVRGRFAAPGGAFRFSCHQDFLQVRRATQ